MVGDILSDRSSAQVRRRRRWLHPLLPWRAGMLRDVWHLLFTMEESATKRCKILDGLQLEHLPYAFPFTAALKCHEERKLASTNLPQDRRSAALLQGVWNAEGGAMATAGQGRSSSKLLHRCGQSSFNRSKNSGNGSPQHIRGLKGRRRGGVEVRFAQERPAGGWLRLSSVTKLAWLRT